MMPKQLARATKPDPHGWRAGIVRVFANALLVLLVATFLMVRWIYVLPALLPVLVGIEYVARRTPHARLLTGFVALAPMVVWELTQSSGDTSAQGPVLGVTAIVFALVARLPAHLDRRSTEDHGPVQPHAETPVATR